MLYEVITNDDRLNQNLRTAPVQICNDPLKRTQSFRWRTDDKRIRRLVVRNGCHALKLPTGSTARIHCRSHLLQHRDKIHSVRVVQRNDPQCILGPVMRIEFTAHVHCAPYKRT